MATIDRLSSTYVPSASAPHESNSILNKTISWIGGTCSGWAGSDWLGLADCAAQWVDYVECSPEVKDGASRTKSCVDRLGVFIAGCGAMSAIHGLLDADNSEVGISELGSVIGSGAGFLGQLEEGGYVKTSIDPSVLGSVGAAADIAVGLNDIAGVLQGDKSIGYKLLKVAENVASVALAALSGFGIYCAAFEVATPALLPFAVLSAGTAALAVKMVRCLFVESNDSEARDVAARTRDTHNARVVNKLSFQVAQLTGKIAGLERGIQAWERKPESGSSRGAASDDVFPGARERRFIGLARNFSKAPVAPEGRDRDVESPLCLDVRGGSAQELAAPEVPESKE